MEIIASLRPCKAKPRKPLSNRKPRYHLDDLLSQCDCKAPDPKDLQAWHDMRPVGLEVC